MPRHSSFTLVELLVVIALAAVLFALMRPTCIGSSREHERIEKCERNLERITTALREYSVLHGHFPPAYVEDELGVRMHSWRVLILPHLDKQELYDAYDFDLSWNSPENQGLATEIAEIFQCPSDPSGFVPYPHTNYLAIVGPGTIWDQPITSANGDSGDALKGSIVVAESIGSDVNVLEPRDLQLEDLQRGINHREHKGVSSGHPQGAFAGFADGHVEFLSEDTDPNSLVERATLLVK